MTRERKVRVCGRLAMDDGWQRVLGTVSAGEWTAISLPRCPDCGGRLGYPACGHWLGLRCRLCRSAFCYLLSTVPGSGELEITLRRAWAPWVGETGLTIAEAADSLGVCRERVNQLIRRSDLRVDQGSGLDTIGRRRPMQLVRSRDVLRRALAMRRQAEEVR